MNLMVGQEHQAQVEEFQRKYSTGLVALVFTDIVDSTALKQRVGDHEAAIIFQRHHGLVRELLRQIPRAEEIETAGDSFFLVFARPSDAVRFSLILQTRLQAMAQQTGLVLADRVGIHMGEVLIQQEAEGEGKPFGSHVDTCSRVMSIGKAGQILMTRSVFDSARQVLRGQEVCGVKELRWSSHGHYLFKGLEEPLEVCEVAAGEGGPLTPPSATDHAQHFVSSEAEHVLGWRPGIERRVPNTHWILDEKLGEGGFGEVWRAYHEGLKEHRVFKFCFRADRARALKREVTLFRLLKARIGENPHIVCLREVYFDEPPFYIEMDYVRGKDLASWCKEYRGVDHIPMETRLEIVAQAADALQAAHDAGIIHRDIKPGNILIGGRGIEPTDVQVKITDFGIGQVVSEECLAGLTRSGFTQTMMVSGSSQTGTQMYMAPELIAGKSASVRSDIFSLGVVLYQLLVGDLRRPVTIDWARGVTDPLLREDLEHCFAGNPEDRFAGAGQLARNLRGLARRRATLEEQQAVLAARERAAYRRGIVRTATVALLIASVFAVLAASAFIQAGRARQNARTATDALNQLRMQKVQELFLAGDSSAALAYLARLLREDAANRAAADRLLFALSQHSFALPVVPPLLQEADVTVARFSPDSQTVIIACGEEANACVRLWDIRTAKPLPAVLHLSDRVKDARFSADGKLLLTASLDGAVRVWDARTGQALFAELRHEAEVNSACFSPDSTRFVTACADGTLRVWETRSARLVAGPLRHKDSVAFAEFSADGNRIVSASLDGTAQVWDVKTAQALTGLLRHRAGVLFARFSPDGNQVATASKDKTARIWDIRTGHPMLEPLRHESEVTAIQFSPDGQRLITASSDGTARLWSASDGAPLGAPLRHALGVVHAEFSSDGRRVVTASLDRTARVWDALTGQPINEPIKHPVEVFSASFSPDGNRALTVSGKGVYIWDIRPGQAIQETFSHDQFVNAASFAKDGKRILTASDNGQAQIWDRATGHILLTFAERAGPVTAARFSANGECVLTVSGATARVWSSTSGKALTENLRHDGKIWSSQFSPDGRRVVTASEDKTAGVWDVTTGQQLIEPIRHNGVVWHAQFSADGRLLATASEDRTVRVCDSHSGRLLSPPLMHDGPVRAVRFCPDGIHLATTSTDRTVRLWDVKSGKAVGELLRHQAEVLSAAFSSDGKRVLTTSADATARVWDARTGRPLTPPMRFEGPVWSGEFSPDGRWIVAGSADGTARIYDSQTGQPTGEPLKHELPVTTASFSPDGKWVLTASGNNAFVWQMLSATGPVPVWFTELAEAVAGQRLDEVGISEPVSSRLLCDRRQQLAGNTATDFYSDFARWFLADREGRTTFPTSKRRPETQDPSPEPVER